MPDFSYYHKAVLDATSEEVAFPGAAYDKDEIMRVLKSGGAYIFTVPITNKEHKIELWASMGDDGEINCHNEAEYHGNPIDNEGFW